MIEGQLSTDVCALSFGVVLTIREKSIILAISKQNATISR